MPPDAGAYPLLMESKARSSSLFYRASYRKNRFTLFQTHSNGGVPLPVGRPDFKSGWDCLTVSGGFDSHPPPPPNKTNGLRQSQRKKISGLGQNPREKRVASCCKAIPFNISALPFIAICSVQHACNTGRFFCSSNVQGRGFLGLPLQS